MVFQLFSNKGLNSTKELLLNIWLEFEHQRQSEIFLL